MEIFKWLDNISLVSTYDILDFRRSEKAFYLNLKIIFVDNSLLQVREYVDPNHRKYSFHWQTPAGELLSRWDNAPHFPELLTFPHHHHLASGEAIESHNISFDEVMTVIQQQLLGQ